MSYEIEIILDASQALSLELDSAIEEAVELPSTQDIDIQIDDSINFDIDYTKIFVSLRGVSSGLALELWEAPSSFDPFAIDTLGEAFEVLYSFEQALSLRLDNELEISLEMI